MDSVDSSENHTYLRNCDFNDHLLDFTVIFPTVAISFELRNISLTLVCNFLQIKNGKVYLMTPKGKEFMSKFKSNFLATGVMTKNNEKNNINLFH